jgi:diadenylate cyclase
MFNLFTDPIYYKIWSFFIYFLDITVISFVLYRLFLLIKPTRTFQMFRGLIFIFIFTVITSFLHLTVSEWLLKGFWAVSLVVAVVVFQPEIRNALAEMGRRRFSTARMRAEIIDDIVDAVKDFSDKKVGIIIVLEKETGLKNYIDTGVKIEAFLTKELLKTIFFNHSPLHDGAVIVRQDVIVAASCVLPLSKQELPKSVGTRHRAAIGVTEVSDAVSVIVSEETGTISLSWNGNIKWNINQESLKNELDKYYRIVKPPFFIYLLRSFEFKNIKRNFMAKLVSLFLGVILWYYISNIILK